MGLDINAVQFLIASRQEGVELGDVLTLGRQDLNVYPAKMRAILNKHRFPSNAFAPNVVETGYAEPVFKALGAKNVYALDASNFEGAGFVHDLNQPLPSELKERFDLVYDGGTLEHVFNFPVALKNCMEMLRPGGRFFTHAGANNWCGHGFYQFSPELYFRVFSEENGFAIERIVAHRVGPYGQWYEVANPSVIRSRVEVITFTPLQLLVRARRVKVQPIFAVTPQQSDYTPRWYEDAGAAAADASTNRFAPSRPKLARLLPGLSRLLHVLKIGISVYHSFSLHNRKRFRPVPRP
jgi:SAM-dependent methyltransferase